MKTLVLPIALLSKNARDKMHWRQRLGLRRDYEGIIGIRYPNREGPPLGKQRVTVTRVKGERERDWDTQNIGAGSAVELLDALKRCGYFADDGPKFVEPVFTQTKSDTLQGPCTVVTLEAKE